MKRSLGISSSSDTVDESQTAKGASSPSSSNLLQRLNTEIFDGVKVVFSIIGFNVRANASARDCANQKEVELRYYSIIYDLVDDIKKAASGLLKPEIKETILGYAEILEVFKVSNAGKVAGCLITEGNAQRSAKVRLLRDNVVIHEGNLKTLKRFKDEVENVQSGQECGMAFSDYEDIKVDDVIEIFKVDNIARTLN